MRTLNEDEDISPESRKLAGKLALHGKCLNKISRLFSQQLKTAFTDITRVTLDNIYFASSPSTSVLQYPVSLPQFDCRTSRGRGLKKISLDISRNVNVNSKFGCTLILIEKLDEVQHIWRQEFFYFRTWGFGLTLTPIPKSIDLEFTGYLDFKKTVHEFVQKNIGESGATVLDAGDITRDHYRRVPLNISNNSHSEPVPVDEIFDDQFHNIVLIPPWPFSKIDENANEAKFPFEVEFVTRDGGRLKTRFNFLLKYQRQPQRLRLKFIFQKRSDDSEICVYSQFLVYTVMPSTVSSSAASIQIYERSQMVHQILGEISNNNGYENDASQSSRRFTRDFLNPGEIDKYWGTGKRIRENNVHANILIHEGYKIGFHYIYEIKPRPNREMQVEKHEERIRERKNLRAQIKTDLNDYYDSVFI